MVESVISFCVLVTALLPLPLKPYQEDGVMWMLNRETGSAVSGVHGGILGDDMGKYNLSNIFNFP